MACMENTPRHIRFSKPEWEAVTALARADSRTPSAYIRMVLAKHIETVPAPAPADAPAWLTDILEAGDHAPTRRQQAG